MTQRECHEGSKKYKRYREKEAGPTKPNLRKDNQSCHRTELKKGRNCQ
jgi:hypothetical protein